MRVLERFCHTLVCLHVLTAIGEARPLEACRLSPARRSRCGPAQYRRTCLARWRGRDSVAVAIPEERVEQASGDAGALSPSRRAHLLLRSRNTLQLPQPFAFLCTHRRHEISSIPLLRSRNTLQLPQPFVIPACPLLRSRNCLQSPEPFLPRLRTLRGLPSLTASRAGMHALRSHATARLTPLSPLPPPPPPSLPSNPPPTKRLPGAEGPPEGDTWPRCFAALAPRGGATSHEPVRG